MLAGMSWTEKELGLVDAAAELEIAAARPDGTLRQATPIWVVVVGDAVHVRTWYRRDTGWFGAALVSRRARVDVPGLTADVTVEHVGDADPGLRSGVDAAYAAKYGERGAASMVTAEAAATTLRLTPAAAA
jgi:hypothetical protein